MKICLRTQSFQNVFVFNFDRLGYVDMGVVIIFILYYNMNK